MYIPFDYAFHPLSLPLSCGVHRAPVINLQAVLRFLFSYWLLITSLYLFISLRERDIRVYPWLYGFGGLSCGVPSACYKSPGCPVIPFLLLWALTPARRCRLDMNLLAPCWVWLELWRRRGRLGGGGSLESCALEKLRLEKNELVFVIKKILFVVTVRWSLV